MGGTMNRAALISDELLQQNQILHRAPKGFGGSGWKHAERILEFSQKLKIKTLLDYGCGECTLAKQLRELGAQFVIRQYDPAIPSLAKMPSPADLVVCTDVLEHVEPDRLKAVLRHLYELTGKGCYLAIATRPANKLLPDGRNAHLIIEDTHWWRKRIKGLPWEITAEEDRRKGNGEGHECRFWLRKVK